MTLPKEGAGRRRVGRGLTIGTEKKVQREEAYLLRREGMARESLEIKEASLRYWMHMAEFTRTVAG